MRTRRRLHGTTWTTGGKYGGALRFNGSTSYVDLGNSAALQLTGSMTWSAWVNAAANPGDDGQIIAKSDATTGWQLKTSPDTGPHTFGVAVSGSSGPRTQRYSAASRSLNVWYHGIHGFDERVGKIQPGRQPKRQSKKGTQNPHQYCVFRFWTFPVPVVM